MPDNSWRQDPGEMDTTFMDPARSNHSWGTMQWSGLSKQGVHFDEHLGPTPQQLKSR